MRSNQRQQKEVLTTETTLQPASAAALPLAQALIDHLNGNVESALARLGSDGVETSPLPDIVAARGHLLLRANRFEEAQKQFERLISMEPTLQAAHYHSGFCLYQLGRFEAALSAFKESYRLEPSAADTEIAIGNCLLNINRPGEAAAVFENCLTVHPNEESALLGKAVALQMAGDAGAAAAACAHLLERKSISGECLASLTGLGLQNSNFGLVRDAADRLLKLDPNSEVALQGLAAAALAAEQFADAAQYYERLVSQNNTNYDYWLNLGVAQHRLGNQERAVESYQKALQIRPEGCSAHTNLGILYQERGDAVQAANELGQALRIAPERDDIRYDAAIALDESGEADKAAELFETLVQSSTKMTDAWFRLGAIRLKSGDFAQAVRCFEKCLELRPDWVEAEINLAIAYSKHGQTKQVEQVLESTLTRQIDSLELVRMLAALSLEQNQFDIALRYHDRLIELGDQSADVRHNLGLLYQQRGDIKKAEAQYQDALTINPDFPEALLNMGNVLNATGRKDAARENWGRALQLKPELALGYYLA
jgi:tetratricopeptide (TPR) repeat protein